jgi:Phosphotransferase enzyme family
MQTTPEAVERLLPQHRVQTVDLLRSSDRTSVERVHLANREGCTDRVVVKRFFTSSGFALEAAALSVLPTDLPVPTLIAEDRAERIIIMTDVGDGPSVADALLGTDPVTAEEALGDWSRALAEVHRSTTNLRSRFAAAVAERDPDATVKIDPMSEWLAGVSHALRTCDVGLDIPGEVDEELFALGARFGDERWEALSPGDTCPDNNVITGRRNLLLVDFEEAAFRHVAWDLAYLRVPWPSCWCAWAIPEPVASTALARYFTAMNGTIVGADRVVFDGVVAEATLAWALISASWFLPSALLRNDTMGPAEFAAPPRRATVLHRLRSAADTADAQGYHSLARASRSWQSALEHMWGPNTLPTAPALR